MHPPGLEGTFDQVHVVVLEGSVLGLEVDHFSDLPLDYQFGAPETGQLGGVEGGSGCFCDTDCEDAVVFCMNAPATEYLGSHLFAVVADQTAPVVAVAGAHGSTIVAGADDVSVPDDNGAHCFLQAGRPLLEHQTYAEEILVEGGPELADNILVMLWIVQALLLTI